MRDACRHIAPDRLPISKTHNPFKMAGADMRSEAGRMFRDLAARVIAEHGPTLDPTKVRELAGLRLSVEIAQRRSSMAIRKRATISFACRCLIPLFPANGSLTRQLKRDGLKL